RRLPPARGRAGKLQKPARAHENSQRRARHSLINQEIIAMREWESFFPEEERKIYEKAGYKGKQPFGRNPALLVIDMQIAFTGTRPMEIMEAIDEFPTSCGKAAWEAIPKIEQLIGACRGAGVPVVYSAGDPDFKAAMGNATKRKVGETDFAELGGRF